MRVADLAVESFDFTVATKEDEAGNVLPCDYTNYVQITQWCSNNGIRQRSHFTYAVAGDTRCLERDFGRKGGMAM